MKAHFLDEWSLKNFISDDPSASQTAKYFLSQQPNQQYFLLQVVENSSTVKEATSQCLHTGKLCFGQANRARAGLVYALKVTTFKQCYLVVVACLCSSVSYCPYCHTFTNTCDKVCLLLCVCLPVSAAASVSACQFNYPSSCKQYLKPC